VVYTIAEFMVRNGCLDSYNTLTRRGSVQT